MVAGRPAAGGRRPTTSWPPPWPRRSTPDSTRDAVRRLVSGRFEVSRRRVYDLATRRTVGSPFLSHPLLRVGACNRSCSSSRCSSAVAAGVPVVAAAVTAASMRPSRPAGRAGHRSGGRHRGHPAAARRRLWWRRCRPTAAAQHGELLTRLSEAASPEPGAGRDHPQPAQSLASPKARGQWGERMADDVLRLAGMVEGVNYLRQTSVAGGAPSPTSPSSCPARPGAAHGREVPDRQLPARTSRPRPRAQHGRPRPSCATSASASEGASRPRLHRPRHHARPTCCSSSPTRASTPSSTSTIPG